MFIHWKGYSTKYFLNSHVKKENKKHMFSPTEGREWKVITWFLVQEGQEFSPYSIRMYHFTGQKIKIELKRDVTNNTWKAGLYPRIVPLIFGGLRFGAPCQLLPHKSHSDSCPQMKDSSEIAVNFPFFERNTRGASDLPVLLVYRHILGSAAGTCL